MGQALASELEKEWNEKLRELMKIRQEFEKYSETKEVVTISKKIKDQFKNISSHLPELWVKEKFTNEYKKKLLRSIIDKIIVKRINTGEVEIKIIWVSGYFTTMNIQPPVHKLENMKDYKKIEKIIKEKISLGLDETNIAEELNKQGFKSARQKSFTPIIIRTIMTRQGISIRQIKKEKLQKRYPGLKTIKEVTKQIDKSWSWIYNQIRSGKIKPIKDKETRIYLIGKKDIRVLNQIK